MGYLQSAVFAAEWSFWKMFGSYCVHSCHAYLPLCAQGICIRMGGEDSMGTYKRYMHVERLGTEECEGLLDNERVFVTVKVDGSNGLCLVG